MFGYFYVNYLKQKQVIKNGTQTKEATSSTGGYQQSDAKHMSGTIIDTNTDT